MKNVNYVNPYCKQNQVEAWTNFLNQESHHWRLYAMTVVFKKVDSICTRERYESEYRNRILNKIKRRLESNPKNRGNAIPFEDKFYYEKEMGSIYKKTSSRAPHHIHSVLPIQKHHIHRFWCAELGDLNPRLRKDLESIDVVQSLLVEPMIPEKLHDYISYIAKGKDL